MNKDIAKLIAGGSILIGCLTYSTVQDHKQLKKNQAARKQQEELLEGVLAKAKDFNLELEATTRALETLEAKVLNEEYQGGYDQMQADFKAEKEFQLIALRLEN